MGDIGNSAFSCKRGKSQKINKGKYKEREYNGKCKSAACIKKVMYYEFPSFGVDGLPLTLPGMRLVEIRVS